MKILKKLTTWAVLSLSSTLMLGVSSSASADLIQLQATGLDFVYDEATGLLAGNNDPLFGVLFQNVTTSSLIGSFATGNLASIALQLQTPSDPTVNQTIDLIPSLGVFNVFIDGGNFGIGTDLSVGSVSFSNGGINLTGSGNSTVAGQLLPFGLAAVDPVNFSFSSGTGQCVGDLGAQQCFYSGTGELAWEQSSVPEPNVLGLLSLGLLSTGLIRRKKASRS